MVDYGLLVAAIVATGAFYFGITQTLDQLFGERWRYAIGFVRYSVCDVCCETMFRVDALKTFVKHYRYMTHCAHCQPQIDKWNTVGPCGHYAYDLDCVVQECY